MPSGVNGTPTIEPLNNVGPNLNDPAPLAYFFDKLINESKVPNSRFNGPDGGSMGKYANAAEGLDKQEIRFAKFINRLRTSFQDVLIKPLWIQMCKDFPELEKDYMFKSQLGLDYVSDNPFKRNQEMEIILKKKESVDKLIALTDDTGTGFFSVPYLVQNYLGLSHDDIKANAEARKKADEKKKEGEAAPAAGAEPAAGAAPAEPAPAAPPA
jgi:hypothetical protein